MNLIPRPQKAYLRSGGHFRLSEQLSAACPPEDAEQLGLLARRLSRHCGIPITFPVAEDAPKLRLLRGWDMIRTPGWYRIQIRPEEITIHSGEAQGTAWALVTLFHLLREYWPGRALPCGEIEDWPAYPYRGQHLDTARHYFPPGEIKRIIEQLSLLKCNVLHWNFANDQAWRLESRAYSRLTEACPGQRYTWEEVRGLVAYGQERGVTIVPEFELPGHSSAAISAYPQLSCGGKRISPPDAAGVFPYILCAGKAGTYDFIQALLEELMELFPSKLFHLGGDEAPKGEWEKCPYCRRKLRELALPDFHSLQAHMTNYASAILSSHGRRAVCWNEGLLADDLDGDVIIQYWRESAGAKYCHPKLSGGRGVILSNFRPFYFDYPFSVSNLRDVYSYRPQASGKPLDEGCNVAGFEGTLWTEYVTDPGRLEYLLFPRAAALAEVAWGSPRDYEDFRRRLASYSPLFAACGIAAAGIEEAEVGGVKRTAANMLYAGTSVRHLIGAAKAMRRIREEAGDRQPRRGASKER